MRRRIPHQSTSSVHVAILLPPPHILDEVSRMAKTSIEFCIISARGLGRRSSLLKPQWFSVAWIDPNSKYCTKVDGSGSSDPSWGMKFSVSVDEHVLGRLQGVVLTVEVYRREPVFLRERLQGTAVVQMKEYFDKFARGEEREGVIEETASFHLRRKKSDKAHGLVDVSFRIYKEEDTQAQLPGSHEGLKHPNQAGIALAIEDGPVYNYPPLPSSHVRGRSQDEDHYASNIPANPIARPDPPPRRTSYGCQPPVIPQAFVPPTSSPSFFAPPYPARDQVRQSHINLPPRRNATGQSSAPNLGLGLGAGALAAGTMILGENLLPGPSIGTAGLDGASFTVSADAPF